MLVGGLDRSVCVNSGLVVVVEKELKVADLEGVESWISVGTLDIGASEIEVSYRYFQELAFLVMVIRSDMFMQGMRRLSFLACQIARYFYVLKSGLGLG